MEVFLNPGDRAYLKIPNGPTVPIASFDADARKVEFCCPASGGINEYGFAVGSDGVGGVKVFGDGTTQLKNFRVLPDGTLDVKLVGGKLLVKDHDTGMVYEVSLTPVPTE